VVASLRRREVRRVGRHRPAKLTHGSSQLFPRASPGPTSALDAQTSLPSRLLSSRNSETRTCRRDRRPVAKQIRVSNAALPRSTSVRRYPIGHQPSCAASRGGVTCAPPFGM
jgi:hypothetical protein